MDDTSALQPKADSGEGDKEVSLPTALGKFREWAKQPATKGFVVGATSVALGIACLFNRRKQPTWF